MMLRQVFRSQHGAQRRAAFEQAHCNEKYIYRAHRFLDGVLDTGLFEEHNYQQARYTWRIERTSRLQLAQERDAGRPRYAHIIFKHRLGARV